MDSSTHAAPNNISNGYSSPIAAARLLDESQPQCAPRLLDGEPFKRSLQWYMPPRRPYSRRELLADRSVNFLGAGAAWLATCWLGYSTWYANDATAKQAAIWFFGAGMIVMLNCSAFYHYWSWDWKIADRLLILDHIGISAMICGCYAPVMDQCGCYKMLAFVCSLGLAVIPLEISRSSQRAAVASKEGSQQTWTAIDKIHVIRYLVMGWACLAVLPTMMQVLPAEMLQLVVMGGLLYTSGVYFFVTMEIEFHLAIWHSFVLLASVCFYLANLLMLVGKPPQ